MCRGVEKHGDIIIASRNHDGILTGIQDLRMSPSWKLVLRRQYEAQGEGRECKAQT